VPSRDHGAFVNRANWTIEATCADCGEKCVPKALLRNRPSSDRAFNDDVFSIYLPARCPKCRSLRAVKESEQ
jgi:hypothetical protein